MQGIRIEVLPHVVVHEPSESSDRRRDGDHSHLVGARRHDLGDRPLGAVTLQDVHLLLQYVVEHAVDDVELGGKGR